MTKATCTRLLDRVSISSEEKKGMSKRIGNASSSEELELIYRELRRKTGGDSPQHKRIVKSEVK